MLISREADYALRILRALSSGKQLSAAELCDEECIPKQFTHKIVRKLGKGGLVEVLRGTDGGCRLISDLDKTTLYDLLECLDALGPVNACMDPEFRCSWRECHGGCCDIHNNLCRVQWAVDRELKSHTIRSLLS